MRRLELPGPLGGAVPGFPERFLLVTTYLFGIGVILPVLLGALSGIPPGISAGFLLLAFALQAIAAPLGLILGLSSFQILAIMACFGLGVILAVFEICRTLGESSERVASFIAAIDSRTAGHSLLRNYGAISCFLIVWIPGVGLYGTPVIAWLLCWKRVPSVVFTFAGFMAGSLLFLFLAGGIR
jgi:hypothetical protein